MKMCNWLVWGSVSLALAACVSEVRDNPLDGKIPVATPPAPVISKVSPAKGPVGTRVTLTGENFGGEADAASIIFGGEATTAVSRSATAIQVIVPVELAAGETNIELTLNDVVAEPVTFSVTPKLVALSSAAGFPGKHVKLSGTTFGAAAGNSQVLFGTAKSEVATWSDSEIEVIVPKPAQTGSGGPPGGGGQSVATSADVKVVVNGVSAEPAPFSLLPVVSGYRCDVPCDGNVGTWSTMTTDGMPDPRTLHTMVWTGSRLVIWGGQVIEALRGATPCVSDGAKYDPVTDSWSALQSQGAPAARCNALAVWTGNKIFLTGGVADPANPYVRLSSGAAYDPASDSWAALPELTSYRGSVAGWVSGRWVIWGGSPNAVTVSASGVGLLASGTAVTVTTAPGGLSGAAAATDATRMFVWGGSAATGATQSGYIYFADSNTWSSMAVTGAPSARTQHAAAFVRGRFIVFGGSEIGSTLIFNNGGEFTASLGTWSDLAYGGALPSSNPIGLSVGNWAVFISMGAGSGVSGFQYDPLGASSSLSGGMNQPAPQKSPAIGLMDGKIVIWGGIPGF